MIYDQTVVYRTAGTSRTIDLRKQRVLASRDQVSELCIGSAEPKSVARLMASDTGSPVRAESLKKWAAQVDGSVFTICPGESGEIEKREKVRKVNVRDRRTRA